MTIAQSEDTCVVGGDGHARRSSRVTQTKLFRSMDSVRTSSAIMARNAAPKKTRRAKSDKNDSTKGPPFLLRAREGECGDKEKP